MACFANWIFTLTRLSPLRRGVFSGCLLNANQEIDAVVKEMVERLWNVVKIHGKMNAKART